MTDAATNRFAPSELSEPDVSDAIARIAARDPELARGAADAYESMTWGEGPGVLRQAAVQEWLWYIVPTKYITDEIGYMGQLARAAAALFDEIGLYGYGAICQSSETARVHAAFDRSDSEGITALRQAMQRSGIVPPDVADFAWSDVMGAQEAAARSAVEDTLERAISAGEFVVGGRGWRASQAQVVAAGLDADHPVLPGQSWRTAVITERLEQWVAAAQRRSEQLGTARAAVANRLLHSVEPPSGAADALRPAMWLLAQFGEEQALTAAGYLTQSFVRAVQHERPWSYSIEPDRPPRSETDDVVLLELREWLQQAGALRKRKGTLHRTAAGADMAVDHSKAWGRLTRHLVPSGWDGFVCETALLHLVDSADEMLHDALCARVESAAADMGWSATSGGEPHAPSIHDVSWALGGMFSVWRVCGLVTERDQWPNRRLVLTPTGVTAALTYLRHVGAGPRDSLW
ncbi:hypothetical protein [Candidatus Poriferisodalis sp.]|uniref:hypothetical protein n=1 Tax=Candidatus Poriferisodalis sp. TaxID=3101277 RepID=UPI003C6FF815